MAKTEKSEKSALIKARCLQKFSHYGKDYLADDLFTGSQAEITALDGYVDSNKDAVTYAENIK